MKKKKEIRTLSPNTFLKQEYSYRQRKKSNKEKGIDYIDIQIAKINKFLTKKGTVKKNLSKRKKEEYNSLIRSWKSEKLGTVKGRKEKYRELTTEKTKETLNNRYGVNGNTVIDMFSDKAITELREKVYLDSAEIISLAKDYTDYDSKDLLKI